MAVLRRSKIPESIYLVVDDRGGPNLRGTYLYHSYQHAWDLKEKLDGRLFKISTAQMTEILT
jgi:hypothetical protein